jgi:hypothetical protein
MQITNSIVGAGSARVLPNDSNGLKVEVAGFP